MADQVYYLRAQFSLADASFLPVTHGDIFQICGKNNLTGSLEAVNVFTRESGWLPRPSQKEYVEMKRSMIGYTQPILLIGSLSSHIHDLLMSRRGDAFGTAVPHTTRARRLAEKNGVDYWFVKQNTMESMIRSSLFVEFGRLGEALYGTTEAAIRCVAQREKKHCLLDSSTSVQHLLSRSIFPIVIFVGAQNWRQLQDVISFDGGSEYQAKELMAKDEDIIRQMRMYLSGVIRQRSLEESYTEVNRLVHNLSREIWLPQTGDPNARLI
ncbi:hypothetical protein PFISCL1PPCAC_25234 [Pristionchus fissidentatus]|uniref:Guanylate kinase-like domain-containing protein n=1 Tax=Pristionchus fissidentatus TaxID=1538716 RepID=A0AAV5WPJ4_9BILA|nr:hypothetical protein PFISCL1PPCAC_25234 [Pristionchus fissidentatus]